MTKLEMEVIKLRKENLALKVVKLDYDEKRDLELMLNAHRLADTVNDVWEKIFRPIYKWSYSNELLDTEDAHKVVEELEIIYQGILDDNNVRDVLD